MREKILKMLQDFYDTDSEDFTVTVNYNENYMRDPFGRDNEHYTVEEAIKKIEDNILDFLSYSDCTKEEKTTNLVLNKWKNKFLVKEKEFKNKKYLICFDNAYPLNDCLTCNLSVMMDAKSPKDAAEQYTQGKVKRVSGEEAKYADIIVESERAYYCYNRV